MMMLGSNANTIILNRESPLRFGEAVRRNLDTRSFVRLPILNGVSDQILKDLYEGRLVICQRRQNRIGNNSSAFGNRQFEIIESFLQCSLSIDGCYCVVCSLAHLPVFEQS